MAKRRSKKARHGRHRKRRLSAKQRRAMMRNLKKARKALRGRKRRHGKRRKSRKGRKHSKRHSRRRSSSRRRRGGGGHRALSNKANQVYQTLINRGRSPQQAHKVAARIDRMRTGKVKRYFEREAVAAKTKTQLHNLFAGFGAAGHLAKSAG